MKNRGLAVLLCSFLSAAAVAEIKTADAKKEPAKKFELASNQGWYGENATKIADFIKEFGNTAKSYRKSKRPIAVFDWDNTVLKNDAGDATFFWLLTNNLIRKPKSWEETSDFLSKEALKELEKNCSDKLSDPLPTASSGACTDTILSIYDEGKLSDGSSAWKKKFNPNTLEPAYAWTVQLMAGHTPREIRNFAKSAKRMNLANKIGAMQTVGSRREPAWARIYPQMRDLLATFKRNGFDIWIVSASSQYVVEVFASEVGILPDHVIGIRQVLDKGKLTSSFEGCGSHPDGNKTLITYREGKRCWLNKLVFKIADAQQMMSRPAPITFAAGDSDTDVFFLKDATEMKLVLNRNKPEIMCNAYHNGDGKWLINPMFIEPQPKKSSPYNCEPYGFKNYEDSVF